MTCSIPSQPTGRIAILQSNFTCLAYANECLPINSEIMTTVPLVPTCAFHHGVCLSAVFDRASGWNIWKRPGLLPLIFC